MIILRDGVTRLVVLIGWLAIKLPRFDRGWKAGLIGLLANMQEREFAPACPRAAPVLFSLWGGWLIVMPRCRPLTDEEWATCPELDDWSGTPVEPKRSSFGVLNGKIVAVDYGS
ncbi:hypothetical protein [Sphingomonas sanguinis]|uniref:hypothetical protein n=1 Tax=Sphingomonas sanguinis TaxID=33051 RepID=UPI0007364D68|nr:hypothetical protein [Sphingomonas sanguinis]